MEDPVRSLSREKTRVIRSLSSRKVRERRKLCIVEGENSLAECHRTGMLEYLVLMEGAESDMPMSISGAGQSDVPVYGADPSLFAEVSDVARSTGSIGVGRIPGEPELGSVMDDEGGSAILFLDAVQDPGNVGGLLRSAWGFGFRAALIGTGSADPFGPKAVRASAGGVFHIPVITSVGKEELTSLVSSGFELFTADSRGSSMDEVLFPSRSILALGNESSGLSPWLEGLGSRVAVPMAAGVDSLNVVVAGSIIMEKMASAAN